MNKLNRYFFGEGQVSAHDGLWFYGTLVTIVLIAGISGLFGLLNL